MQASQSSSCEPLSSVVLCTGLLHSTSDGARNFELVKQRSAVMHTSMARAESCELATAPWCPRARADGDVACHSGDCCWGHCERAAMTSRDSRATRFNEQVRAASCMPVVLTRACSFGDLHSRRAAVRVWCVRVFVVVVARWRLSGRDVFELGRLWRDGVSHRPQTRCEGRRRSRRRAAEMRPGHTASLDHLLRCMGGKYARSDKVVMGVARASDDARRR